MLRTVISFQAFSPLFPPKSKYLSNKVSVCIILCCDSDPNALWKEWSGSHSQSGIMKTW